MKNTSFRLTVLVFLIFSGLSVQQVVAAIQINIPAPAGSGRFGNLVTALPNGNIIVTDPEFDLPGLTNVGAVYLYNGATGVLISRLTGSTAGDSVGNRDVRVLPNGNYVVVSVSWSSGAGAITWCNGTTGCTGAVSLANSLVGSTSGDNIGSDGITILTNGNFVVHSQGWDNGGLNDVGAVTLCNGTTGCTGAVSPSNSLVGSAAQDRIGSANITVLTNGNYIVSSSIWNNGPISDAGAVSFCNGTTGCTGLINPTNSLVGSTVNDNVGVALELTNGNYVVVSSWWDNGITANVGAVTFCNGVTGCTGVITSANSLIGSTTNDSVGRTVKILTNGNYVVDSESWNNGAIDDAGAVTFCNGTTGCTGEVSAANSLVGSRMDERIGNGGVTALTNGNYVVSNPNWNFSAGAVTFCNGTIGCTGAVSAANSLVGARINFSLTHSVMALPNGNYVANSSGWSGNGIVNAGAVTFCNGTTGCTGEVSSANSLVGSTNGDFVGDNFGVMVLTNGNYVVSSESWDNGTIVNAGAATWCSSVTGCTGVVSAANSLVGSSPNDSIGRVLKLTNGNYVVNASGWDNGTTANVGAVTWCNGTIGCTGTISSGNSLIGSTANEIIGSFGVTALTNGNYVVNSPNWNNNGAIVLAGAVTWCNGTAGCIGTVSPTNSLVGSTAFDRVGTFTIDRMDDIRIGRVVPLINGDYVVHSSDWRNGTIGLAGAISFGNGSTGTFGAITADNSVRGTLSGFGSTLKFSFDAVNYQLIVGRPFENIVTLFRPTTTGPTPTPTPTVTPTPTATPTATPTPTPGNVCTPVTTVTEGDLFPGGIVSFGVTSGPGSVTVDHVNAGTGLQSLTVVSATNAIVNVPAFTPGTTAPVVVTFTPINPGLAVDFTLRAASQFHAANIRARCAEVCTPTTTVTEGNLFPGGIVSFGISSAPGSVTIDHVNAGTGLQSLTITGTPVNASVNIPAFTAGTTAPVVVTFTPIDPNQPVDFTLRAASTFHAANVRVRCGTPPNSSRK